MDLTHLRYFRAIAESGSLSAAARKLKVSQPTLSGAVQSLEADLGTTLLLRTSKGVTLTQTGRALVEAGEELFLLLARTEERIRGLESEEEGTFVLGCHESLGAYFLPPFLAEFMAAAPKIEVRLHNGSSGEVREAVVERQVEFGLIVNPLPHPDLVLLPLFQDAVAVLVSAAEPRCQNLAEAQVRLRKGPLIYAGRVGQCQELIGRFAAEASLPDRRLDCGDLELVKSLALAGLGVALLPERVAAYGHPGALVHLHPELPSIPDTIFLVFRGDLHRTKAALRLKEALVAYGRRLAPGVMP